jgi:cation transport regulator
MEYKTKSDLPETLRAVLPDDAQEVYLHAYQEAWDDYEEGEGGMTRSAMASQVAWRLVKKEYVQDKKSGAWYKVGEGPDVEDEEKGIVDRLKDALGA